MGKYEVMLYPKAYRDIDEIYFYIAFEKQSPENAKGQTDRIWDAILGLDAMPSSHKNRDSWGQTLTVTYECESRITYICPYSSEGTIEFWVLVV
jgi:plasmid stabilization system protein ParE